MDVMLISTIAKSLTPKIQVYNENGAGRHQSYDKQGIPAAQDEERPGCS